jgi:hypothetical protein
MFQQFGRIRMFRPKLLYAFVPDVRTPASQDVNIHVGRFGCHDNAQSLYEEKLQSLSST